MDALAALALQLEWDVDETLEDAPVDRLRAVAILPPQPSPASRERAQRPPSPAERGRVGEGVSPAPTTPTEHAAQVAARAATLEDLRAAIAGFDRCALRDTATHLVFAAGDPAAGLILIGDPPGADDDRSGTPFAGPAGAYLDRMLASIGLERERLLLAPLIPWRPPGGRPPSPSELAVCLPFLGRLIALVRPHRLVLFGPLAARALLPPTASRRRPRGAWVDTASGVPALPTFSAAELLRSSKDRRVAWADLRLLRRTLDTDAGAA